MILFFGYQRPIYHIIGNVSENGDGTLDIEAINDVSSVVEYKGVYHVFHQCCQNHWDHVGKIMTLVRTH